MMSRKTQIILTTHLRTQNFPSSLVFLPIPLKFIAPINGLYRLSFWWITFESLK